MDLHENEFDGHVQLLFQSTLPVGGATQIVAQERLDRIISIHAPRGGSDSQYGERLPVLLDFNPRSPWGERLVKSLL